VSDSLQGVIGAVAPYAGLAGIAVGAVLWTFRELITKNIFPQLSRQHACEILKQIINYSFLLGIFGIGAWVYTQTVKPSNSTETQSATTSPAVAATSPAVAATGPAVAPSPVTTAPPIPDDVPWKGAIGWMGSWLGDRNDTDTQKVGDEYCEVKQYETYVIEFTSRASDGISGSLVTDLTKSLGEGNSAHCKEKVAEYRVKRTYTVSMSSEDNPGHWPMKLVVVDCKLDGATCRADWWVAPTNVHVNFQNSKRFDYVEVLSNSNTRTVPIHRP